MHVSSVPTSKRYLLLGIFLLALAASIGLGLAVRSLLRPDSKPTQHTTLYYRDGRTVLWQTGQDTGKNTAFITFVTDQLREMYGQDYQSKGTWKVTTSLDKPLQDTALQQVDIEKQNRLRHKVENTALVAQDVTNGQIVSWVSDENQPSGTDTVRGKIEMGTLATTFTYIAFLEQNPAGASTIFDDSQGPLPGYLCNNKARPAEGGNCLHNFDYRYLGQLTLSQALGGLRNVATVRAAIQIGISKVHEVAEKMGSDGQCYQDEALSRITTCYESSIFGAGMYATPHRLVEAYSTLANRGSRIPQTALIKTSLNNKTMYEWSLQKEQIVKAETAQTIASILSNPDATPLRKERWPVLSLDTAQRAALAPGFSSDGRVASAIEFSDRYAVGVWSYSTFELAGGAMPNVAMKQASDWLSAAHSRRN